MPQPSRVITSSVASAMYPSLIAWTPPTAAPKAAAAIAAAHNG